MPMKPIVCLLALAMLSSCAPVAAPASGAPSTGSPPAELPAPALPAPMPATGAVSSADPRASAAGEAILAQGGSASDAAIAVMLALSVVEPQSSGIGGGGFMLHANSAGEVVSYDGRETAPASATGSRFLDDKGERLPRDQRVLSGLSVGVPGNLALAAKAHSAHGKLAWDKLFEPAIALARDGFLINQRLYNTLQSQAERAAKSDYARALFFGEDGEPRPVGTRIRNPEMAAALEQLADQGARALYEEWASGIAAHVAGQTPQDGKMTPQDIQTYQAKLRAPVCATYRGHKVCGMGPPSSGGIAVLQMLGQLERFDLASLGPQNPQFWHLFLESQRVAYADRALYIGDSDFVEVPVNGLIDPGYIAARAALIDPAQRRAAIEAGTPPGAPLARAKGDEPQEYGTSHFSVTDARGNAVSYTSTIEGPFGSGLTFAGFYLNNELTDFSSSPQKDGKPVANRVEGGKRPRSSMAPTIVFAPDGKPVLVVGAAGGPTIPVQTARTIIGVIDLGLSANDALGLPFIMGYGDAVLIEEGSALEGMQEALQAMGHAQIAARTPPLKANALLRTDKGWEVGIDPRLRPLLATQ